MLSVVQRVLDRYKEKTFWEHCQQHSLPLKVFSGFAAFLAARYIASIVHTKYTQSPPGEIGVPVIGSLISAGWKGERFYIDIARNTNCPLYMYSLGLTRQCVINNAKLAKQILSMDEMLARPKNFAGMANGIRPFSQTSGTDWESRRTFFETNLMILLNKKFVQENIKRLLNKVIYPKLNHCDETHQLFYCRDDIQFISFNVMYNAIFGEYVERSDPLYVRWISLLDTWVETLLPHFLRYLFFGEPMLTFLRRKLPSMFNQVDVILKRKANVVREMAKRSHIRYDKDNISTYYGCMYSVLSQKAKDKSWDELMTGSVLADLDHALEGGTETTASTLDYCIAAAAKHEAIQDEIYDEIQQITDNMEEYDLYENLLKFPKLRAFVEETLRLMPVLPTGVFRQVQSKNGIRIRIDENTEYVLPDKSMIFPNIVGMQRDPKYWKNPEQFDINRWLDEKGRFTRKRNGNPILMSFTVGPRSCPGRELAYKSMYLIMAMLFSKYKLYVDDPEQLTIRLANDFTLHVFPEIGVKIKIR